MLGYPRGQEVFGRDVKSEYELGPFEANLKTVGLLVRGREVCLSAADVLCLADDWEEK